MTLEVENTDIFGASVVDTMTVRNVKFFLFSNRIFYVRVPKYEKIDESIIEAGYWFLNNNGRGKFYNVYHFESFAEADPETRKWAASADNNKHTICDAIVIGSMSQKLVTDFYLRINKPVRPTKTFFSLPKAVKWIHNKMNPEAS